VVLLVLAILWGVLLVSGLRSRSSDTFANSVGTFRYHLRVLERATPRTVTPANRLRGGVGGGGGHMSPAYRASAPPMRGQRIQMQGGAPATVVAGRRVPLTAYRRRQAQKRRRDVFFTLLAGAIGFLAVAMIPGVSVMWPVQGLFDVLLITYVALLVRMRNVAAERELRATFSSDARRRVPAPRPAYDVGGTYGHLGPRRAAPGWAADDWAAYEFEGHYGELGLRRAAS
jgi:hypothetical protein